MQKSNRYSVVSIHNYFDSDAKFGENDLRGIFSDFSCEKNPDVENFLKRNAIDFTKKNQSVTYLVFGKEDATLLGYFTIAVKPITVHSKMLDENMSSRIKKKIRRVSQIDEDTMDYNLAAYLIAQLGKNDALGHRISGHELVDLAIQVIEQIQKLCGGMVVFLETNDHKKLIKFYQENGFQRFATRKTQKNDELVQLLRVL